MKSLMCDADLSQLSGGGYFRKFDYNASKGYLQIVIAKCDNSTAVGDKGPLYERYVEHM